VNSEALLTAAGLNLKRLLKARGWGRRLCPSGAAMAAQQSTSSVFCRLMIVVLIESFHHGSQTMKKNKLTVLAD